jgi:molybdate transport system substrate-binding protein
MSGMRRLGVVLLLAAATAGCGSASGPVTLSVAADSAFTDALPELGTVYHRLHPDVTVRTAFGGSRELVSDIDDDHRSADVLVTADQTSMDGASYVKPSRDIAHDTMTIAVAPGNPLHIQGPADLSRPGVKVSVAAPNDPAGRYAQDVFVKAGVTVRPVGAEIDVRTVLDRVRTGQADAGVVYLTDLRSAGASAAGVAIPAAQNVTAELPAAVLRESRHQSAAKEFLAWLGSAEAKAVLSANGFQG